MKTIKQIIIAGLFLSYSLLGFSSSPYFSSGNAHSAVVCGNGSVFTFGSNSASQLGRDIIANDGKWISIPGIVDIPVAVSTVDAGYSHTLALACDSSVWAWGAAANGTLGNGIHSEQINFIIGVSEAFQQTPVQVLAGETNLGDPFAPITGVTDISAGHDFSLVVLSDGKVASFGKDEKGSLGSGGLTYRMTADGETSGIATGGTESPLPVYVRSKYTGQPLENVITAVASDYSGYALVDDDNDGDPATGRVYAWGESYDGSAPLIASAEDAYSSDQAVLVVDKNNEPLTGISKIAASSEHALFLEKTTGYLYSVGSNAAGIRGLGLESVGPDYATKVPRGEQLTNDGDDYLSNVVDIATGQTYCMAVVKAGENNYLMTWGGAVPYLIGDFYFAQLQGGHLGRGQDDNSDTGAPRYVLTSTGEKLADVQSVSAGGGMSVASVFDAKTGDTKWFVFGDNSYGQLGLGIDTEDSINRFLPAEFILPPCKIAEACPVADLGPKIEVCEDCKLDENLFAGSVNAFATYNWTFVDSKGNSTDVSSQTSEQYGDAYLHITNEMKTGKYIVEIIDTRPLEEQTCNACPTVSDTISIQFYEPLFDTISSLFCDNDPTFKGVLNDVNSDYEFFDAPTAGNSLGKGVLSGDTVSLTVSKEQAYKIYQLSDSLYGIWVDLNDGSWSRTMLTAANTCVDEVPLTIFVDYEDPSYSTSSDGSILLTVKGGEEPYRYEWNTGQSSDKIAGLAGGTYTVTVTDVLDNRAVQAVHLDALYPGHFRLEGTVVDAGETPVAAAVYLLSDITGLFLPYMHLESHTGSYSFSRLPDANYILFVVPLDHSIACLPTFAYDALSLETAYILDLNASVDHFNIALRSCAAQQPGTSHISGTVFSDNEDIVRNAIFQNALKSTAMANVPVVLYCNGDILAWDISAEDGSYSFDNIPEGQYSIYAMGYPIDQAQNISVADGSSVQLNLDLDPVAATVDVTETGATENVLISNPVSSLVRLNVDDAISVRLIDNNGIEQMFSVEGNSFDVSGLEPGVYFAMVYTDSEMYEVRLVKQ